MGLSHFQNTDHGAPPCYTEVHAGLHNVRSSDKFSHIELRSFQSRVTKNRPLIPTLIHAEDFNTLCPVAPCVQCSHRLCSGVPSSLLRGYRLSFQADWNCDRL